MGEAQLPGCRRFRHHPSGDGLVEGLDEPIAWQRGHTPDDLGVELPAEDRGHREHVLADVGELPQAPADDLLDSLRNPQPLERSVFRRIQAALVGQQLDDLPDEQRVALGLPVHRGQEAVRRGAPDRQLDETRHLGP